MSLLAVHEHGKHTVDGAFSTTISGQRPASPGDRYAVEASTRDAQAWRIFRGPSVGRWDVSRPPPSARPPTLRTDPTRRTNPRRSRHGHKPRRADQMRPRIPFFLRGLLFRRDFRISLSLEFRLDRGLSLAKIHASKNTPRASRARLENENGMRRSRPRARRGTKNV